MRKITFLSVLFLLTGWVNTWAQTLVSNVSEQLTDGTIVALQCRDTNGGPNYYFNGKAVKSAELSYSNLFKIRNNEDGTFALQSMLDGTYIGKDGADLAIKATKADAAPFTATIIAATNWTTVVPDTENGTYTVRFITSGTFLNAQGVDATPKYATGTGGYSIWYVYTFTPAEAKAMQPYVRFASPRGGYLSANGESGNLQHIDNDTETSFWKIELNEGGDGVKLYNVSQTNPLASVNGFSEEGAVWYILDNPHRSGYKCISLTSNLSENCIDAQNQGRLGTGYWQPNASDNEGTSWQMLTVMSMRKFTITYHIKDANGNLIKDLIHEDVMEGDPFPAIEAASGPTFCSLSGVPEGTVTANGEYEITVTMAMDQLPFTVSTIDGAFHWYTITVHRSPFKYSTYNPETGVVNNIAGLSAPNDSKVFAFTGDPFNGFKIYNRAAGADKQLYVTDTNNESCTFAEEGAVFGLYKNNTIGYQFKLVGSQATHLNDVNSTLGVWTHANSATDAAGGTFTFTTELDAAKENLTAALNALKSELGTDPGYVLSTEDIDAKITAAETELANTNATIAQINAQAESIGRSINETLPTLTRIMPEAGKFYMIINAFTGFETHTDGDGQKKAMYSDGTNVKWGALNELDRKQVWTIVPTEGGYVVRNYADQTYPTGVSAANTAFTAETEETVTILDYLNVPGQFNVKFSGYPAHAGGHGNGAGRSGDIINWAAGANGCSAWYIHEVEEPTGVVLENVTFNYTVNGVVKKSIIGNYDTANPEVPATYAFVTIGEMTLNSDNTVTVPCTCNLPFTASESYANATWYAVDMHGTQNWAYEADQENNIKLPNDLSMEDLNSGYVTKNRRWAFVGDPFNGFKIYNQAAGETMTLRKAENGNGTISVMSEIDDRNVFFLHETNGHIEHSFAWKLTDDSSYLNHQGGTLKGYGYSDEGSSCRVYAQTTAIPTKAFYRIKGGISGNYISAGNIEARIPQVEDKTGENEAKTIYYFDGERKLLNYSNGLYIYKTSQTGAIGEANTWEIKEDGDKYIFIANHIQGCGSYMYDHTTAVNRNSIDHANCRWYVEPVTELPVTVSAAGYATLFAPTALTIPADVEVYTGTINTEKSAIELSQVADVIPANTAVLVKAAAGTYNFEIAEGATAVEENALQGTISTAAAPENVYTLQNQNSQVGFYPYTGENINGFKAYITIAADADVQGLTFDFGDATGIEEILSVLETSEKATEIYDLAGRRVAKPVKGIYIKGGKKVIVK